jgi:predicted transglutaminase-like cysteine proteinase
MAYQAGELVVEPLAEGHHVLDVGESRGLHLLDQLRDEVTRLSTSDLICSHTISPLLVRAA